jgi:predicted amidohydrolase
MKNITIALVQTDIRWHDIEHNLKQTEKAIGGMQNNISLIILPEMFTTGFTMEPEKFAEDMETSPTINEIKKWSASTGADITGSIIIRQNGHYFNRLVWASPDGNIRYYDKSHLFRIAGEDKKYSRGNDSIIVEKDGWKIMPLICYDLRFPVFSRNIKLAYDILLFTANWPASRQDHWESLLKARAIENQCYVIGVNRTGAGGNGLQYDGGSAVFDFSGKCIAHAGSGEKVIECICEYNALVNYRKKFPFWMDADEFSRV